MKDSFAKRLADLESKIEHSYNESITMEDSEKLAGEFLHAQMQVSHELRKADLDARMRKSGLKTIKAAVYKDIVSRSEKRPTEAAMEHELNAHELVSSEQIGLDDAESLRDEFSRLYQVFQAAHVHFRQMSKGQFGG